MGLKQFFKRGQGGFFSAKPPSCIYFFLTSLVGVIGDISSLCRTCFAFILKSRGIQWYMNFVLSDFSSIRFLQTQSLVFFFHTKSSDYILNIPITVYPNYCQVILHTGINMNAFCTCYTGSNCCVADYFHVAHSGTFCQMLLFAC